MNPHLAFLLLLCAAANAGAQTVADEVSAGSSPSSGASLRRGFLSDRLWGGLELGDAWELHAEANLTYTDPSPATTEGGFGHSASTVFLGTLGVEWLPTDPVALSLDLGYSPPSQQEVGTTLSTTEASGATSSVAARVRSTSTLASAVLGLVYQTSSLEEDSDFASTIDGSAGLTRFDTTQRISSVETAAGSLTTAQLLARCRLAPKSCQGFARALKAEPTTLHQLRLGLGLVETVKSDNDLILAGAYFLYDTDPAQAGYFSVVGAGRSIDLGAGVPVAPLWFTVSPGLTRRFGALSLGLTYKYGRYVDDGGDTQSVAVKAQLKFLDHWKGWVTVTGTRDVDGSGQTSLSGVLAIGLRWRQ